MIKQKLLATTALISLLAGSALADGPAPVMDMSVKIGGMFDAHAVTRKANKEQDSVTTNNQDVGFATDAQVYLEAKNTTAKGLEYGAHLGLTTHAVGTKNPKNGMDRSWLWLQHADMGRMEFGSNNGSASAMRIGADNLAVATGGISGKWTETLTDSVFGVGATGADLDELALNPWNIGDDELDLSLADTKYTEKARKITYYTPKMNGFQFGVSYIPDVENKGNANSLPNTTPHSTAANFSGKAKNIFTAGLSWDGKVANDVMGSFSVVGLHGKSSDINNAGASRVKVVHNQKGFDVGGMLKHKDLSAALSYGSLGKSHYLKTATNTKSEHYVTAGVGYDFDKLRTSLTFMHGHKNHNRTHLASLGAEYALAAGIMPYAEATYYSLKQKNYRGTVATPDNAASTALATELKTNGTVFILGTKLNF